MIRAVCLPALALLLLPVPAALGQYHLLRDLDPEGPPQVLKPAPMTEAARRHAAALKCYLRGQTLVREHRLPEAQKAFEEALQLEPNVPAAHKALGLVCFGLDRPTQGLAHCKKALELDPADFTLGYRYARELAQMGQAAEAADVLTRTVHLPELADLPAELAQMLFDLGNLQEQRQQFAEAAHAYERVSQLLEATEVLRAEAGGLTKPQIDAEAAKTYERLGQAELQAGRYDEAVAAFTKAQAKAPERAGLLHYRLAEVYLARKEPAKALPHLERYLATQPGGAEPYLKLIALLGQLGREAQVVPALEKASQKDPFNLGLKMLLADRYAQTGQGGAAERLYLAALEDYAAEEACRGLAKLYQQQGRWADLVQRLDHDFADPRNLASARAQVQIYTGDAALAEGVAQAARALPGGGQGLVFQTRRVLATLCRQIQRYDLAEHFARLCLADDPQPGDAYLELCRILSAADKPEAEAAVCREALTRKLKVPPLTFRLELARSLAFAGKVPEAVAAAEEAVKDTAADSPERAEAEYNLVVVLYKGERFDAAAAQAEALLPKATEPRAVRQLHYLLSGIHGARKDNAQAEAHLQKLLELDPDDAGACNDLGYLWADQNKNLEEAERLIRKALEIDGHERRDRPAAERANAAFVDSLGWVLYRRGHKEQAAQELERAGKLQSGDDPVIWDHLGEVYRDLGKPAEARAAWAKALELYGKSKRVGLDDRRREVQDKLRQLGNKGATEDRR